jgi:DNA-binding response OmpR family regulator
VLVVDDEPAVRKMAAKALAADGHSVELASGCEEGRQMLKAGSFDLVLADAMLGDGTAFDLCDSAGARRPAFLVMTGNILDPALAAEFKRRGLSWLPKPFDIKELREALARALPSRV